MVKRSSSISSGRSKKVAKASQKPGTTLTYTQPSAQRNRLVGTTYQKSLPWRSRISPAQCHITVVNWLNAITVSSIPTSTTLRSLAKWLALAAA